MARKPSKPRRKTGPAAAGTPDAYTQILLEDMRAQNRATIEAVEASYQKLDRKLTEKFDHLDARVSVLETIVRQNSEDIRKNGEDIRKNSEDIRKNSEDIRVLQVEVSRLADTLARVETAVESGESRLSKVEDRVGVVETRLDKIEAEGSVRP